jgi:hypothetical protein
MTGYILVFKIFGLSSAQACKSLLLKLHRLNKDGQATGVQCNKAIKLVGPHWPTEF